MEIGQLYLSIVYLDKLNQQWLFYPDYIIKLKNGEYWIIETKGGEKIINLKILIENLISNFSL